MRRNSDVRKIFFIVLFAISMAYVESAVVCYLRKLFYPSGFSFPLPYPPVKYYLIEVGREVATICMLISTSFFLEKGIKRIAYFLILFGIWDIFYYFWLFLLIKWPSSIFDWDILFLIPVAWASPVICPLIVSLILIIAGILTLSFPSNKINFRMGEKIGIGISLSLIFLSFTIESLRNPFIYLAEKPVNFYWEIFTLGILLFSFSIFHFIWKNKRSQND